MVRKGGACKLENLASSLSSLTSPVCHPCMLTVYSTQPPSMGPTLLCTASLGRGTLVHTHTHSLTHSLICIVGLARAHEADCDRTKLLLRESMSGPKRHMTFPHIPTHSHTFPHIPTHSHTFPRTQAEMHPMSSIWFCNITRKPSWVMLKEK